MMGAIATDSLANSHTIHQLLSRFDDKGDASSAIVGKIFKDDQRTTEPS